MIIAQTPQKLRLIGNLIRAYGGLDVSIPAEHFKNTLLNAAGMMEASAVDTQAILEDESAALEFIGGQAKILQNHAEFHLLLLETGLGFEWAERLTGFTAYYHVTNDSGGDIYYVPDFIAAKSERFQAAVTRLIEAAAVSPC